VALDSVWVSARRACQEIGGNPPAPARAMNNCEKRPHAVSLHNHSLSYEEKIYPGRLVGPDRPHSGARGYDAQWRKVRAEVLSKAGIPENEWPSWDVDHDPRYPLLGPDHSLYRLTPVRRQRHSAKTIRETHQGIQAAWRQLLPRPGELFPDAVYQQRRPLRWED
jgi:hypothetical protein